MRRRHAACPLARNLRTYCRPVLISARPSYTTEPEWMDAPGHPRWLIEDNLGDLRRVNRLLGGTHLTLAPLRRLLGRLPTSEHVRVLDVATGAADIPRAVCRWLAHTGRGALVVATDLSYDILRAGRDASPAPASLAFVVADATALPFRDGAFHAATSSLALHHMLREQAVAMLREQGRCASRGVVVNDLVRSWLAYLGAIAVTRLFSRNRLTRHDGPLSVRRAFTASEMRTLARRAGLVVHDWHSFLFYRVSFTAVPDTIAKGGRA
jgi:hypothetical protein